MAAESFLKKVLKKIKLNESTISTLLGAAVVIVIGSLVFNYFRNVESPTEEGVETPLELTEGEVKVVEEEGQKVPKALPTTYQVQTGDNLWKIAEKFYGSGYNWVDIAKENKLTDPGMITEGESLSLPRTAVIEVAQETGKGAEMVAETETITGDSYAVQKGDNLWDIAVRAYGDGYRWPEIASANNLVQPGLIHAGNTLTLPR